MSRPLIAIFPLIGLLTLSPGILRDTPAAILIDDYSTGFFGPIVDRVNDPAQQPVTATRSGTFLGGQSTVASVSATLLAGSSANMSLLATSAGESVFSVPAGGRGTFRYNYNPASLLDLTVNGQDRFFVRLGADPGDGTIRIRLNDGTFTSTLTYVFDGSGLYEFPFRDFKNFFQEGDANLRSIDWMELTIGAFGRTGPAIGTVDTFYINRLPADLNVDHSIDAADASTLFTSWGGAGGMGDINRDRAVDALDAGILFGAWTGDAIPTSAVPEPVGHLAMFSIGALWLWRAGRR